MSHISVPEMPMEVDFGQWIIDHPGCDTIFERIAGNGHILVYAYATSDEGNDMLHTYRDERLSKMKILQGVSADGIRQLV
jgi:hypothetical protein